MRRLARALVKNAEDASDLTQDAWVAALRRPPRDPGSIRSWVVRVLRNGVQNRTRGAARRRAREALVGGSVMAGADSPEDLTARMELQHRLVALIAELDEISRKIIHLRFFEDRDSTEIAAALHVPAGTVRWRLKMALDTLRTRLDDDAEAGDRRWVVLLGPLAAPGEGGRQGSWFWRCSLFGGVALMLTIAVGYLRQPVAPAPAEMQAAAARLFGPAPPPRFTAASAALAAATECPEPIPALRTEIAERERELFPRRSGETAFERGRPNSKAQQDFAVLVDERLKRVGRCAGAVECRDLVCRVKLLAPVDERDLRVCFGNVANGAWIGDWPARLRDRSPWSIWGDRRVEDVGGGRSYRTADLYLHLARLDGAPVPVGSRVPSGPVREGRHRSFDTLPPALSATCRREAERLQQDLVRLWEEGDRIDNLTPIEAFTSAVPNGEAELQMEPVLRRLFGPGPLPVAIACRGRICRIAAKEPAAPDVAIRWTTKTFEGRSYPAIDAGPDSWYGKLARLPIEDRTGPLVFVALPQHESGQRGDAPVFAYLRSQADRARPDPMAAACRIRAEVKRSGVFEACAKAFPAEGVLALALRLKETETALRAEVQTEGPLAEHPVGRCVRERLTVFADDVARASRSAAALVVKLELSFPDVGKVWERPSMCEAIERAR